MKKRIILIIFVLLLVGVAVFVYLGQLKVKNAGTYYSGTIEATNSQLSFQVGGRVAQVEVGEGEQVTEGHVLARLDASEYRSRQSQADANLKTAQRTVEKFETVRDVYRITLPADVIRAEAAVASARAVLDEAEKNRARFEKLSRDGVVSQSEWESVKLKFETASAQFRESDAVLRQARSNLTRLETAEKDIEVARAQVLAALSALQFTEIQLGHTELSAPFAGTITSRNIEPGEVVTPGREVLTLSDLQTVDLKIFVDETNIGEVRPGQDVEVRIDTFPDKVFEGTVSFISPEGEFTPKIIQTQKERVKLVYLVKVAIPNPELILKPGMPADAYLQ